LGSTLCRAQDFASLFQPGKSRHFFQLEESIYSGSTISGSPDKLQTSHRRARASAPVWDENQHEITLGVDAGELKLNHPDDRLKDYRTLQGSVGWRSYGRQNKVRSFNLSYGSASDKLFDDPQNTTASLNYLHQTSEKWWVAVNWSNNRNFANNIPIPGFFYVSKASREETLLLGLPFVFWRKRYENGFGFQMLNFFPWNHQFEASYSWKPFHQMAFVFEHRPQQFLTDDRVNREERFFYVEQKASLVVQGAIIPFVFQWRVEAGHAFKRRVFEAENFSQSKRYDLPLGDANFLAGQLTSFF
jgi:hypothetical protein